MTVVETQTRTKTVEQEQVERGAALLDTHRPLWHEEINLDQLELNECDRCVIGQLYGDYYKSLLRLGIQNCDEYFGFFVDGGEFDPGEDEAWARLTEAWRDEIARRRT